MLRRLRSGAGKWRIAVANPNDENQDKANKSETRVMVAFSAGILLLILGMMGANMLVHHPSEAEKQTEFSSQSQTPAPN